MIKVPVTISPHYTKDKFWGYYIIVKKLFTKFEPILVKNQFVGFNGNLLLTVGKPNDWDSLFKIAMQIKTLDEREILWLGTSRLNPFPKGFKAYLSKDIIPEGINSIETVGVFWKAKLNVEFYYLELPKITAQVLLGKEQI